MTDTMMKPVHIINVPLDLGASRRGTDAGPSAFRIAGLSKAGNDVTLFLVENGVMPTRKSEHSAKLSELVDKGVEVLADDFSLSERGIDASVMTTGIKSASIDVVVDQLAEGRKAIWQ